MTYNQLLTALNATGYPVSEGAFSAEDKPAPPYITVQRTGDNALYADGAVYWYAGKIEINLYTASKNATAEAKVRNALTGSAYKWAEARNASQDCYACTITMEV